MGAQAPQETQPAFRADVELFLIDVQLTADRGKTVPALEPSEFVVRIGSRTPAVVHAARLALSGTRPPQFRMWTWPADQDVAVYELGVEADAADCRKVPKVKLARHEKWLRVRSWQWSPKAGCKPPGAKMVKAPP
jgi:hypothetical protein